MEIKPRLWSLARSSLVQTSCLWLSVPARGFFAARRGIARVPRVMERASEKVRWRFISPSLAGLRRGGRKMAEHFVHAPIQILDVLLGVVGECVARRASP